MSLYQIVLRLARNPGFPEGDEGQGYVVVAPLDDQGRLDPAEWHKHRDACSVFRFKPGDDKDADGRLSHRGGNWFFHYDEDREGADEPVYRLGEHQLAVGDYITIHENDGQSLTYRVSQRMPYRAPTEGSAQTRENAR